MEGENQGQVEESEETEVTSYAIKALNNNVILRRTFSFLKFADLKNCRRVNKKWLDESKVFFREQSVIKIRYDRKEPMHIRENTHSVEEFLTTFRTLPLSQTFSGVIFQFFVCGHSFQWNDVAISNFMRIYGPQITYLKLSIYELLYGETKKFDLFLFKKSFSEFLPNLAHLSVNFCGRHLPENIPIVGEIKGALGNGTLPMLRKLEWEWEVIPPDPYSHHVSNVLLADLLTSSPNLNCIITKGTLFNSDAYNSLSDEGISRITEICFYPNGGCTLSSFFNKIVELGTKTLRLSTLNVTIQETEEEWLGKEQEFISYMIQFLETQKNCLTKLRLSLPYHDSSTNYNFPPFPKMSKLVHLELRTSMRFPTKLLRESYENWGSLFPRLETLAIACTYAVNHKSDLYFSPKVLCVPEFLFKFGSRYSGNIKSVFLHSYYNRKVFEDFDLYGQQYNENTAAKCYGQVKKLFPNIIKFQIFEIRNWKVYAFNGSVQNFVTFCA